MMKFIGMLEIQYFLIDRIIAWVDIINGLSGFRTDYQLSMRKV